jgi:hypothetical protein
MIRQGEEDTWEIEKKNIKSVIVISKPHVKQLNGVMLTSFYYLNIIKIMLLQQMLPSVMMMMISI